MVRGTQLSPDQGPLACFAIELRALREAAGANARTVKEIANQVRISTATIYQVLNGRQVPRPETLVAMVTAWGGDQELWLAKRSAVIAAIDREAAATSDPHHDVLLRRLPPQKPHPYSRARVNTHIATVIRTERLRRQWSTQYLADRCQELGATGLNRGTIAKIETGVRQAITADEALVLATALDIRIDSLLGRNASVEEQSQPVPKGETVALIFSVSSYSVDGSGHLIAHLKRLDRHGEIMAETLDGPLGHDNAWLLNGSGALDTLAATLATARDNS